VFTTIDVCQRLSGQVICRLLDTCRDVIELLSFEAVEKKATETLIEILLQTLNDFLEDVSFSAVAVTRRRDGRKVFVKDDTGRLF
jgi:hypothetical protein